LTDFLILMANGGVVGMGPLPILMRTPALLDSVGLSPFDNILPVTILAHDVVHHCTLAKFFGVNLADILADTSAIALRLIHCVDSAAPGKSGVPSSTITKSGR
jgi:hypothetical protein